MDSIPVVSKDKGERTRQVLDALYKVAMNLDEHAYAGAKITDAKSEWLYDFYWCNYQNGELNEEGHLIDRWNNRLVSLPIVAECEWGEWWQVIDDFEKLLIAGKGTLTRVMIYDANQVCDKFEEILCS